MANLRRINQEDLRNHNLSVTLDTLLRAQKPMSRADLAKETGLTKATLSLLASMLIESGVVQEGEPVVSTTYGRPSTPLEIRGGSIAGIGLQINTDGYGCLALDLNGDTLGREWVSEDMTGTDPYEIFAKLDAMTFPLESRLKRRGCKVVGAGFALPGIVTDDMWLLVARNLGWENVNLTRFNVVRRLDVVAGNEAKMAAIAQIPGYATERAPFLNVVDRTDSFIYLSTDIGIGGGICQSSSTIYNAAVRANMKVEERYCHKWASSYVPTGLDATIDYGNLDLKLSNPTDYQMFLECKVVDSTLYVSFWGWKSDSYDLIMTRNKLTDRGGSSYTVKAWRVYYKDGKEVDSESLGSSTYDTANGYIFIDAANDPRAKYGDDVNVPDETAPTNSSDDSSAASSSSVQSSDSEPSHSSSSKPSQSSKPSSSSSSSHVSSSSSTTSSSPSHSSSEPKTEPKPEPEPEPTHAESDVTE